VSANPLEVFLVQNPPRAGPGRPSGRGL